MSNIADTMVMANLLGMGGDLSRLASDLLHMEVWNITDITGGKKVDMDQVPLEKLAEKCIRDCRATLALYTLMLPELSMRCKPGYLRSEFELIPILIKLSLRGILLDQAHLQKQIDQLRLEKRNMLVLCEDYGFNPGSPMQVGEILTQRGNRLPKGDKTPYATGDEVLKWLSDPLAHIVLQYRQTTHTLSHYLTKWEGRDRIHTLYHLQAETGRLASRGIQGTELVQLQNIPKGDIRGSFLPDTGIFTDYDYKQQELRIMAHLSGDQELIRVCETSDPHQSNADFMGIDRRTAKNVTYAMMYGGSIGTIMETAGIQNFGQAMALKETWEQKYSCAWQWISRITEQGLADRWVYTVMGRPVAIPVEGSIPEHKAAKKPVNFIIQGTGGDVIKESLRRLDRAGYDIVLTLHDENLLDGRVECEELQTLGLENILPFRLPLDVDYLTRWK